jgi:hypothetical protein
MKRTGSKNIRLLSDAISALKKVSENWVEGWSNPLVRDVLTRTKDEFLDEYHELSNSRPVKKSAVSNSKSIPKKD